MKRLMLTSIFMIVAGLIHAQDFSVPTDYKFETAEDYAPYEQDILNCANWLIQTPLSEQSNKRKEANAFLLKWLMGSPYLHIEIKQEIVTFMNSSPDLLMIFMGGWAKYSLESKDFDNKISCSLAGIESVIEFYVKNRQVIPKDKNVEKYIKMKKKGTLKEYVEENA